MMLIETIVRPSGIHGMGLFAAQFVPRGTPVWKYEPGFDRDFSPAQFAALPALAQEHTRWFCFVSQNNGHVILSGDHACFINHSLSPNTGALPQRASGILPEIPSSSRVGSASETRGSTLLAVVTHASRDIAAAEEITCNYFDYDADAPWKLGLVSADAPLGAKLTD